MGLLCAEGPKTITSALCWLEQRYEDWSREYRLLSQAQAAYAALLLAQMQAFGDRRTDAFDALPAWRKDHPLRPCLRDLIALLRKEAGAYIARRQLETAA